MAAMNSLKSQTVLIENIPAFQKFSMITLMPATIGIINVNPY